MYLCDFLFYLLTFVSTTDDTAFEQLFLLLFPHMLEALLELTELELSTPFSSALPGPNALNVFPLQCLPCTLTARLKQPSISSSSSSSISSGLPSELSNGEDNAAQLLRLGRRLASEAGEADVVKAWTTLMEHVTIVPYVGRLLAAPVSPSASSASSHLSYAAFPKYTSHLSTPTIVPISSGSAPTVLGYFSRRSPSELQTLIQQEQQLIGSTDLADKLSSLSSLELCAPSPFHVTGKPFVTPAAPTVVGETEVSTESSSTDHRVGFTYSFRAVMPEVTLAASASSTEMALSRSMANPLSPVQFCLAVQILLRRRTPAMLSAPVLTPGQQSFGTLVSPVNIHVVLEALASTRQASPNMTFVGLSLTNTGPRNLRVKNVSFDLKSTWIGRSRGSLERVNSRRTAESRIAPNSMDVANMDLLANSVSITLLNVEERRPILQPLETFTFQFCIQLKPHLTYLLLPTRTAVDELTTSGKPQYSTNERPDVGLAPREAHGDLLKLLQECFHSAVHVSYDTDCAPPGPNAPPRMLHMETMVPWALGRSVGRQ